MMRPITSCLAFALALAAATPAAHGADALDRARAALEASRYDDAEKLALEAEKGPDRDQALLVQARLRLLTGRYDDAIKVARRAAGAPKRDAAPIIAEALVRSGKRDDAIKELESLKSDDAAHRAHVMLGELYIAAGRRSDAEEPLMKVIDAYNNDVINGTDADGLTLAGRAAQLLRHHSDANALYDKAEAAGGTKRVETLLYRAELFFDKYNPGRGAQMAKMALEIAPNDPRARVAMAHAKLEQAMDFGAAEEQIGKALAVDPQLAEAYFVRAGLALRTMDLEAADKAADAGLKANPNDLELLAIKAATRFLADDDAGLEALEKKVLALDPQYARFYIIVGEFAEWEHRYAEIVKLMKKAVQVDPAEGKAYAALGLNLIRDGEDAAGLDALRKSWSRDDFNQRVFNTLNFYEQTVAQKYVTVDGARFRIRYHKDEKAVLERYVPPMLEKAWASMVQRYGFTPVQPVGIEMYADPEHFSIRTSGLPHVGIQGVCFGKTLAALSPAAGSFNWGMIVWHELSHVFHIQQSKSHVPRWFTEGLAEYETILARPEWRREEEQSLFFGMRDGKIPKIASFNKAFTHVDNPNDVVMAYYAASQIQVFSAETFGFDKFPKMLTGWAAGKRTETLVPEVYGISADEFDQRYRAWQKPRLARYDKQFMPDLNPPGSVAQARKTLADDPKSASKHVKLALALLAEGHDDEALATLQLALQLDPAEPDALFIKLKLAMARQQPEEAKKIIDQLVKSGHDGFAVRMKAADVAESKDDYESMKRELVKAHQLDPSQAEPLQALHDLARKQKDDDGQLYALRELAKVDQHDRRVWRSLLAQLVKRGLWDEAVTIGESAMYVDVMGAETHYNYARALARTGRHVSAIFELNSAAKANPDPKLAAQIYQKMAEGYRKLGKSEWAAKCESWAKAMNDAAAAAKPAEDSD
jgi:cellulose synthase operon protein C